MKFINKVAVILYNVLFGTLGIDKDKEVKILYAMEVLLSEFSKILIMFITFSIFHKGIDFLLIMFLTIPLRMHIGGFHMNSYFKCLGFSMGYCLVIILLHQYFTIIPYIFVQLSFCSGLFLLAIAPVIPVERRDISTIPKNTLKKRGLLIVLCYTVLFVLWHNDFTIYGQWIIIIQTLLLLVSKGDFRSERQITETT